MEGGDPILQDFDSVKIRLFILKSKKPLFWNMRIMSFSRQGNISVESVIFSAER